MTSKYCSTGQVPGGAGFFFFDSGAQVIYWTGKHQHDRLPTMYFGGYREHHKVGLLGTVSSPRRWGRLIEQMSRWPTLIQYNDRFSLPEPNISRSELTRPIQMTNKDQDFTLNDTCFWMLMSHKQATLVILLRSIRFKDGKNRCLRGS